MSAKEETRKTKANEKKMRDDGGLRHAFSLLFQIKILLFSMRHISRERTESLSSRLAGFLNYNDREKKGAEICRLQTL